MQSSPESVQHSFLHQLLRTSRCVWFAPAQATITHTANYSYACAAATGKRVKVEPLTAVATPKLHQLLSALLMMVQSSSSGSSGASSGSSSSSKVTAMVEMDRCLKLQSLVVQARHCLAPALRGGNKACEGR